MPGIASFAARAYCATEETPWDSLPLGDVPSEARPANVAMHLASLLRGRYASSVSSSSSSSSDDDDDDDTVAIAACIGNERLGKESIRRPEIVRRAYRLRPNITIFG